MTTVSTPSGRLTTGWEPDLPPADTLLRRFLFAYADRIAQMARLGCGRTEGNGDARCADLASPFQFDNPAPLPPSPPELRVVEVDGGARLGDFERTLMAGYPLPAAADGAAIFDPRQLGGVVRLFVGYLGDSPVSVAGAAVGHGVVEVDWVATLPSARGRGYGGALTAAAAGVAPDLPAVLLSSDAGQPVYRRLGFVDLLRCTIWERHP